MSRKRHHQRDCPVAGHPIDAAECGAKRGPAFGCPEECPHNPWSAANYEPRRPHEGKVLAHLQRRLERELGTPFLRAFREAELADAGGTLPNALFTSAACAPREGGRPSVVDAWIADGLRDLRNDERVFLRSFATMRVAVLEFHRLLDDHTLAVVDLLQPERGERRLVDVVAAEAFRRFAPMLGFVYETPFYLRPWGPQSFLPTVRLLEPAEILRVTARHGGWDEQTTPLPAWLMANAAAVLDTLEAVQQEQWFRRLEASPTGWSTVDYEYVPPAGPEETARRARKSPWFVAADDSLAEPGEVGFDVVAARAGRSPGTESASGKDDSLFPIEAPDVRPGGSHAVAAALRVRRGGVRLEGIAGPRFETARHQVEHVLGGTVRAKESRTIDHADELRAARGPRPDPSRVPEELVRDTAGMEFVLQAHPASVPGSIEPVDVATAWRAQFERLPDEPIPALGGMTPREAAADPQARPALVRLMKQHVAQCDHTRYRRGIDIDLDFLLEELGLSELRFPPPPLPDVPEEFDDDVDALDGDADPWRDDDDEDEDEWLDGEEEWHALMAGLAANSAIETFEDASLAPPPIQEVVSQRQLEERLKSAMSADSPKRMMERMERAWPGLQDAVIDLLPPSARDHEVGFVSIYLMLTVHALRAQKRHRVAFDPKRLRIAFLAHTLPIVGKLENPEESHEIPDIIDDAIGFHAQPEVARWLVGATFEMAQDADAPEEGLAPETVPFALGALMGALWEISCHPDG